MNPNFVITDDPMLESINWTDLLEQLAEPFEADAIYWRAGATTRDKKRAQALPYADPRVYEDRLNTICPGLWQVGFVPWGEHRIICSLTIAGVTRSSTGEESDGFAPGTAAEAQAFKRACSKFGLGRYLYDIPIQWVEYDEERRRLAEIPELPKQYLPQSKLPSAAEGLSAERAHAMSLELERIGFAPKEQRDLVKTVLGRRVRDFTKISETEAMEVWSEAKRMQKVAA